MSNEVQIEITETRMYQITVDLDDYDEDVTKAYKEQDASFFNDFLDDSPTVYIEHTWG